MLGSVFGIRPDTRRMTHTNVAAPKTRRRPLRLPSEAYANPHRVFGITFCTEGRAPIFANESFAEIAVESLKHIAKRHDVTVYAYVFMPDHVHLVASPSERCGIVKGNAPLVASLNHS